MDNELPNRWSKTVDALRVLNKQAVPETGPTLNAVLRLIAQSGGSFGRKSDGEPGVKSIWKGAAGAALLHRVASRP